MDDPNLLSDFRSFCKCDYYSAPQNRSERDKRQLFFSSKMRLYRLNLDPAAGTDSVRFPVAAPALFWMAPWSVERGRRQTTRLSHY